MRIATGEEDENEDALTGKNHHAVELGRAGGLRRQGTGGKANSPTARRDCPESREEAVQNCESLQVVRHQKELAPMADPKKYRDEAERLRRKAEHIHDRDVRRQAIEIADQYDRLADSIEEWRQPELRNSKQ
jgi:hypothetical protein